MSVIAILVVLWVLLIPAAVVVGVALRSRAVRRQALRAAPTSPVGAAHEAASRGRPRIVA